MSRRYWRLPTPTSRVRNGIIVADSLTKTRPQPVPGTVISTRRCRRCRLGRPGQGRGVPDLHGPFLAGRGEESADGAGGHAPGDTGVTAEPVGFLDDIVQADTSQTLAVPSQLPETRR